MSRDAFDAVMKATRGGVASSPNDCPAQRASRKDHMVSTIARRIWLISSCGQNSEATSSPLELVAASSYAATIAHSVEQFSAMYRACVAFASQ